MRGRSADRMRAKAGGRGPRGNAARAQAKAKPKVKSRDVARAAKPVRARAAAGGAGTRPGASSNGAAATTGTGNGRDGAAEATPIQARGTHAGSGADQERRHLVGAGSERAVTEETGTRGRSAATSRPVGTEAGVTAGAKGGQDRNRFRDGMLRQETGGAVAPPLPTPIASFIL